MPYLRLYDVGDGMFDDIQSAPILCHYEADVGHVTGDQQLIMYTCSRFTCL